MIKCQQLMQKKLKISLLCYVLFNALIKKFRVLPDDLKCCHKLCPLTNDKVVNINNFEDALGNNIPIKA